MDFMIDLISAAFTARVAAAEEPTIAPQAEDATWLFVAEVVLSVAEKGIFKHGESFAEV